MYDVLPPERRPRAQAAPDSIPSPAPRFAVQTGAAALAASLVIAGLLANDPRTPVLRGPDAALTGALTGPHGSLFTVAATVVQAGVGGPPGLVGPLLLVGYLLVYRRWWSALYSFLTCAAANVLLLPLKSAVDRPRPADPWILVSGGSFPSVHAYSAAALTVVLSAVIAGEAARRRWWLLGAGFTLIVMWTGVWVHSNWPSDAVAGALAGAGTALLLWKAFSSPLRREAEREAASRRR
ncbi:phosphatase PAP2 family protein [Kitasatospora sp. NBC_00374]|uniref:phosphatase PAP2 family protein n=1 Tax=Kitasatospora sp. NBC_00374 TaxID=2975964 RepID=UPI0030E20B1F